MYTDRVFPIPTSNLGTDRVSYLPARVQMCCSVNEQLTRFSTNPVRLCYVVRQFHTRSGFTMYRPVLILGTVTRVSNYSTGQIHLHCWHHQLLPRLGHTLRMVEYPDLALFRILSRIHKILGRVLQTTLSQTRPFFFTPRPGA